MLDWTLIWSETLGSGFNSRSAQEKMGLSHGGTGGDGTLEGNSLSVTSLIKLSTQPQPPVGPQEILVSTTP